MNIICKMVGIRKLSYLDVKYGNKNNVTSVYEFTEDTKDNIKKIINILLFESRMDSVLVNYNNQLFVCISTDIENRKYAKKVLIYHPLGDKVEV